MKTNKQKATQQVATIGIIALAAMIVFAVIACKNDDGGNDPQPVAQELPIVVNGTGGNSVTVIIKYKALPGTTPSYMSKLQQALSWMDDADNFGNKTGTITINVISGNTGFVKNGSKTLDVGDGWLIEKSDENIYDALTLNPAFIDNWFTMLKIKSNVAYCA